MTPRDKQAGFTLVEILTVLVIIGLMASAVVMTLPREKPAIYAQSEALVTVLNGAAQNSLITGRPHALAMSKTAFAIYDFQDGEWLEVKSLPRPDGVKAELRKNNLAIKLTDDLVPVAVFEPTGLATPFELVLSDFDREEILVSSGDGRVTLQDRET